MMQINKTIKNLRCIHRHSIDEHPNCFAKGLLKYPNDRLFERYSGETWYKYPGYKIGYFDIETDNLYADFGTMLSWCIKEKDGDIKYSLITKDEIFGEDDVDKRLIKEFIKVVKDYKIIVGYNSCLTSGHKILKSNLEWVNVEDLKVGDELLAFDSEIKSDKRSRNFRKSVVTTNIPVIDDVYKITLKSGKTLTATKNHPWLVQRHNNWVWRRTDELIHFNNNINSLTKILDVWEKDDSRDAGYLAGFFDSEGGIYQAIKTDRITTQYNVSIQASQHCIKNKVILDKIISILNSKDFKLDVKSYDNINKEQRSINIRGGKAELLRFIGTIGLEKIEKLDLDKLGELSVLDHCEIESIEYAGKDIVYGLGTSTETYIADGFPVHNTNFDLPFLRAKALRYGLEFPGFSIKENSNGTYENSSDMYHFDLYYTVKSKLRISRKSLDNACDYLKIVGKTPINKDTWRKAKYGNKEALLEVLDHNMGDVVILEKLHDKLEFSRKWIRTPI